MGDITTIANILEEAKSAGEDIDGLWGTAKAIFGGAARQVGVPISDRASRLSDTLKKLQFLTTPEFVEEARVSDKERARVADIVGDLSVLTDEVKIRQQVG